MGAYSEFHQAVGELRCGLAASGWRDGWPAPASRGFGGRQAGAASSFDATRPNKREAAWAPDLQLVEAFPGTALTCRRRVPKCVALARDALCEAYLALDLRLLKVELNAAPQLVAIATSPLRILDFMAVPSIRGWPSPQA